MRRCPFCKKPIPEVLFTCRPHWYALDADQKSEINASYNAYLADEIDLAELRRRQQVIIDAVRARR